MFADQQADWGQFVHRPSLGARHGRRLIQRHLTRAADDGAMLDQLVGSGHQMQRLPRVTPVSKLAPRPLAAAPTLAARAFAPERIAGGWFVAVVAIFGEAGLQLLHLRQRLLHLRQRLLHLRQRLLHLRPKRGHLGFQLGDAVVCCAHGTMLHLHRKSARTVPPRFWRRLRCIGYGWLARRRKAASKGLPKD